MKKLAIVSTHPIQYNAPWFSLLQQRGNVQVRVFYTWSQTEQGPKYDPTFKRVVEWDIPLLNGYDYEFVPNISKDPGSHHFKGVDNPTLIRQVEKWQPDAVLVIGWSYKSHLTCMRYFKGKVPVLFRGDSTLLDETKGIKTLIRRIFLTWVYRYIDKALYVGTNNKAYFKAHGVSEKKLVPAYHAIDNDRFASLSAEQETALETFRNELGIKKTNFVVLFAGKFEEKKNPFFLLELAKQIPDPAFVFLLVGNGELEEKLKAEAAADSRVKFLPFQNQSLMPVVYSLGHVLLLPSKGPGETWGLAANEAMATGLPVILSTKTGGAVDLVKNNGLAFDLHDTTRVGNYLVELKNRPENWDAARQASLQHIQNFSFTALAQAVEKACGL